MTPTEQVVPAATDLDSYTKELFVDASPHQMYEALTTLDGLRGWWTRETVGDGEEITFRFGSERSTTMRVLGSSPSDRVTWECVAQNILEEEWVGTRISFEIQGREDGGSRLRFTHLGLTPQLTCYGMCERGWDQYLASLESYLTQGSGTPWGGPSERS
jgi:uncharacterized protein YndB with AHSA1/START domain